MNLGGTSVAIVRGNVDPSFAELSAHRLARTLARALYGASPRPSFLRDAGRAHRDSRIVPGSVELSRRRQCSAS